MSVSSMVLTVVMATAVLIAETVINDTDGCGHSSSGIATARDTWRKFW